MVTGIIGKKVGMTQVFDDGRHGRAGHRHQGRALRRRAGEDARRRDGYEAVQLGLVEERPAQGRTSRSPATTRRPNVPPTRVRREVKVAPGGDALEGRRPGARLDLRRRRPRRRDRHQPRQGLPGRRQAPPLPRRRRDPRLDVPPRARVDRRLVVSRRASSRACARPGRMGGDAGDRRATCEWCRSTPRTTCCCCAARCPGAAGGYVIVRKAVARQAREPQAAGREAKKGKK